MLWVASSVIMFTPVGVLNNDIRNLCLIANQSVCLNIFCCYSGLVYKCIYYVFAVISKVKLTKKVLHVSFIFKPYHATHRVYYARVYDVLEVPTLFFYGSLTSLSIFAIGGSQCLVGVIFKKILVTKCLYCVCYVCEARFDQCKLIPFVRSS